MRFTKLPAVLFALAAAGILGIFDADGQRVGWGRRNVDARIGLFAPDGLRLGHGASDGRAILGDAAHVRPKG